MSTWVAVVAVGVVSYLFRAVPVLALARVELPPVVERSLRHAGPSAMAAMSALALAHHQTSGVGAATLAAVVAVGFSMVLVHREVPLALVVAGGLGLYQIVLLGSRVIGGL
jgi:branched-subunit amino acid transport protein